MMTVRNWALPLLIGLVLTGLGFSALANAQSLNQGESGEVAGDQAATLGTPGEPLPVNIDPFADAPLNVHRNEPLIGLDGSDTDGSYSIELTDEPELIIKQHSFNPLIDLGEEAPAEHIIIDEDGIPTLGIPPEQR